MLLAKILRPKSQREIRVNGLRERERETLLPCGGS